MAKRREIKINLRGQLYSDILDIKLAHFPNETWNNFVLYLTIKGAMAIAGTNVKVPGSPELIGSLQQTRSTKGDKGNEPTL